LNTFPRDITSLLSRARDFLEKSFGYRDFRPGQEAILEAVFSGEDTLAVMPTGAGKSICYQVPALILPGTCLVISPLIALMKDQVDSLRVMDLPAVAIHSLMSLGEQEEVLQKIASGAYKLVYAAPERLRHGPFISALGKQAVSFVAVDEAHCISEWGHDFRPDYLRIGKALDSLGRPQTIALTATATERVREDIIRQLRLRSPRKFITGFDRKNLTFDVAQVKGPAEKFSVLAGCLKGLRGGALVYAGTRKSVEELVGRLRREGLDAAGYHAGMEEDERNRIQEAFLEGRTDLVVATNAFGMGIDRSDIRLVVHHQLPGTVESYYQECGRAGRDGKPARCLLLFSAADRRLQEFFIESSYPPREVVLGIYESLLEQKEDPLWLTYREIGALRHPAVPEAAVGSALRILEDAGAVHRLNRYENRAELYLRRAPSSILESAPRKTSAKSEFLKELARHYTGEELVEGIQFVPEEMMDKTRLSRETFRRVMSELEEHGEGAYIPPFRGRGLRLQLRVPPGELTIDFEKLRLRKAHELEKLNQVMAYGTLTRCRRAFLLEYFGEYSGGGNCGGCDVCRSRGVQPVVLQEQGEPLLAVKVLSGVARLRGRFGREIAVKMLTGSQDKTMEEFSLDRLSTFGLLSGYSRARVGKWLEELLARGFIKEEQATKEGKSHPALFLTPRGEEAMKKREAVPLSLPVSGKDGPEEPPERDFDSELFEDFRKLRQALARKEGLPPYCIFQDRTLREMAGRRPGSAREMLSIVGVGEVTLRKYGHFFLELISSRGGGGRTGGEAVG
jgi:ATP-dependent DNA helicase RecQ